MTEGRKALTRVLSHMSISAEANLPVWPKWILMNFPCWENQRNISDLIHQHHERVSVRREETNTTPNTYKTGRVVVPYRLGISKSLHGRICLDDLIFQSPLEGNADKPMMEIILINVKCLFFKQSKLTPVLVAGPCCNRERHTKPVRFVPFL